MQEFSYTITDEQGIHARPAGLLVKEASKYESAITISHNGKTGDAKKIFSVMGLGIKFGDQITVSAEGTDEDQAAPAINSFLKENL